MKRLELLENEINYKFKNKAYLIQATTHSSYANEHGTYLDCNERLEFLGDSVLSLSTSKYLYDLYPEMTEGDLSKLRSSLVCTQSLSEFANQIHLGEYIRFSKGEQNNGGATRPSILEDAFESLIAAIYLDGGMEPARNFVLKFMKEAVKKHDINFVDYKTTLQEVIQKNPDVTITYAIVRESGPDHDKEFEAELRLNSNVIGRGIGKSKKSAEQQAAKEALSLMGL